MNILKGVFRRAEKKTEGLVYGATDKGKQRTGNEDCYLIMPELNIYAVADGMGGYNAGAVASLKATETISEFFNPELVLEMRHDRERVKENLSYAIIKAHEQIMQMSRAKPEYAGMGTTIAISFIHESTLHTCHVGDTRVYVINPCGITQITQDHSTVGELVRRGEMTKEEARHSPLKNQVTQAIGTHYHFKATYNQTYRLNKGDMVLMCSDGLWEMLSDGEIRNIIMQGESKKRVCENLVRRANDAGGNDNITVVLFEVEKEIHTAPSRDLTLTQPQEIFRMSD